MKTWNRLFADARKSVGLTQAELAAKGGISGVKTVWLNTSPDPIDDPFRMQ